MFNNRFTFDSVRRLIFIENIQSIVKLAQKIRPKADYPDSIGIASCPDAF